MTSTIASMTGFARTSGHSGPVSWAWEVRSVNGKGLDVRLRLPPGYDRLEQPARQAVADAFKRGSLQLSLQVAGGEQATTAVVNEGLLQELLVIASRLQQNAGGGTPDLVQLLNVRGVVDVLEAPPDEADVSARDAAIMNGLAQALRELAHARKLEGARLAEVLSAQVNEIESLCAEARANPSRKSDVILKRLAEQVQRLMDANGSFDQQRLHQEAVLLATKADIQEELDRLASHIVAARKLLQSAEPVGRKFDFLVQEFNREANTLCSKSSDASLTATGLALKTVIDQLREQVQNIE